MQYILALEATILKEFRDFVMRGNVMDLAIAVILGAAFGAIIISLVNDILMPLIGIAMGGDKDKETITLKGLTGTVAVTAQY